MKGQAKQRDCTWLRTIIDDYKAFRGAEERPISEQRLAKIEQNPIHMKAHELIQIFQYMHASEDYIRAHCE